MSFFFFLNRQDFQKNRWNSRVFTGGGRVGGWAVRIVLPFQKNQRQSLNSHCEVCITPNPPLCSPALSFPF